ncbi:DUF3800 domain-containing protein [Demequina sp. NBRC 110051]|uniref:DUF3800 domain-containing protein n=1 Tax=Demequina sp. NBRC 110051 TaxID=1570340 RepID=UPI000A0001A0|nr:DUF3800 domain-containing protein [Demequina sp. NBRC 110051]
MSDVYIYADEYGDLDFSGNPDAARYFGVGTATFRGRHGDQMADGFELRCSLEARGVDMPRGFHAQQDSRRTRHEVFSLLAEHAPRFDTTFLAKSQTQAHLRRSSKTYLYKLALYLHLKWLVPAVAPAEGTVYIILGSLQTAGKRDAVRAAIRDVCTQIDLPLATVVPCIWDAPSSWGIQAADYGLWAVQRDLERADSTWLDAYVRPTLESRFLPWGTAAPLGT